MMQERKNIIHSIASQLGFDYCGIAKAEKLDEDAERLEKWLSKGMHGSMQYMERYFDQRVDPRLLVPGAKSVITLLLNYYPSQHQAEGSPNISKYAYGRDYHEVIKEKLHNFLSMIKERIGELEGRGFVDSAPVLERSWAQRAGLGWVGKNGNLITKTGGSFFFIATLITDLELEADFPFSKNHCGSCNRCVEACPTDAILPGPEIDGRKCISYFTIELKEMLIPDDMKGKFDNWAFGCDICQDVCPWNRFSTPNREPAFQPIAEILDLKVSEWEAMGKETFRKIFKHSPINRTKYEGMMRNIKFIQEKS
jgi:epoxyqueuosine reductase